MRSLTMHGMNYLDSHINSVVLQTIARTVPLLLKRLEGETLNFIDELRAEYDQSFSDTDMTPHLNRSLHLMEVTDQMVDIICVIGGSENVACTHLNEAWESEGGDRFELTRLLSEMIVKGVCQQFSMSGRLYYCLTDIGRELYESYNEVVIPADFPEDLLGD